jgi:hypothetical protein
LADHPGNIVSVDNEILNVKGTFDVMASHPKSVLIGGVFGPGRFKMTKFE